MVAVYWAFHHQASVAHLFKTTTQSSAQSDSRRMSTLLQIHLLVPRLLHRHSEVGSFLSLLLGLVAQLCLLSCLPILLIIFARGYPKVYEYSSLSRSVRILWNFDLPVYSNLGVQYTGLPPFISMVSLNCLLQNKLHGVGISSNACQCPITIRYESITLGL